ncbi:hypothetical protein Zmor_012394 [Zophobas morio]|uniref:Uncharacterized protein n=1 Tax=Zophobas morio TaxID=2755281 RepID=A0AA38LY58_9CUCU|nr:hypothetical protein Zmor_012394 [Zophobas morio]
MAESDENEAGHIALSAYLHLRVSQILKARHRMIPRLLAINLNIADEVTALVSLLSLCKHSTPRSFLSRQEFAASGTLLVFLFCNFLNVAYLFFSTFGKSLCCDANQNFAIIMPR